MQSRAAVRRAGRRAEAKLRREPFDGQPMLDYYVEEKPAVTTTQRVIRRAVAVLIAILVPVVGSILLLAAAFDQGKGYQVAPVMTLMVAVLFGIPAVSIAVRHARTVWHDTKPE